MRIALVGPAHPYKGGGARHTTELAHRLTEAGHDVSIESWRAQYPARLYPGQQTVDEAEGEPYPRTRRRLAWYSPWSWFAVGSRLRNTDLVVFALLTPIQIPAYLVMLIALGRGKRTVALCHNVLPHERRPGDVLLTRALLGRVGGVLVHSPDQAAQVGTLAPRTPVTVAPLPFHWPHPQHGPGAPTPFAKELRVPRTPSGGGTGATKLLDGGDVHGGRGVRLLFFGIVRPYKGLDVLLRALAEAPAGLTLTVAGEFWGGTADTERLIAELGITDRVTLRPGYVKASEVPALFAPADVLVLPYRTATASQNALLAFAYGVPVIATTAGALAEHVIDGVNGFTARPGDVDSLLKALRRFSEPGMAAALKAGVEPPDAGPAWAAYAARVTAPYR